MNRLITISQLRADREPEVATVTKPRWFGKEREEFFRKFFPHNLSCYVELGSFLGASAQYVVENWPTANVIAIDHFLGSPEHFSIPELEAVLPNLMQHFMKNLWPWRDRVFVVPASTWNGLVEVRDSEQFCGGLLVPQVIYIDACHERDYVLADTVMAATLFPNAFICGDDYGWFSVADGVAAAAKLLDRRLCVFKGAWYLE